MIRKILLAGASAAAFSALVSATAVDATTYTINFGLYPLYTPVTGGPDVTISLQGAGSNYGTVPVTGSFGTYSLGNSSTGEYPTANILDFSFASPVSNISFFFDNFGGPYAGICPGYRGCSYATTFDSHGVVEGSTSLANAYGGYYRVAGSTVSDLQFSNGANDWEFGVYEVTYTTGVPEPATWAMMLGGFGFVGYILRRRVLRAV